MGHVLNGLVKLQSVENRIRAVKAKLARCRRNTIIQESQVRILQNALEAKREEIQLTRVQSDRLELELRIGDEAIARLRAKLAAAKTNREYAAILTQLNTTKADNSKIENQVLESFKVLEADEAECQKIQAQIDQQTQLTEKTRKETELSAANYEAEIKEIQAEWDRVAKTIPPQPLEIFKRLAQTYDGEALAEISRQLSRKAGSQQTRTEAYSCGGCFMSITAESVNLLMTTDDIIRCPNCTRILVLGTVTSDP